MGILKLAGLIVLLPVVGAVLAFALAYLTLVACYHYIRAGEWINPVAVLKRAWEAGKPGGR